METINNYWGLDISHQKEIIKKTETRPISPGKRDFTVMGEILAIREYYCDCKYCRGHKEEIYFDIDEDVYANNPEQAIQKALVEIDELAKYDKWEWSKGDPIVIKND